VANKTVRRLLARVREWREARGLSQEAFAERAGLTYKHYQAIEAGRKPKIQLPTIEKLAKGCGLELSELFDFNASLAVGEDPPKDADRHPARRRPRKNIT
jgi:transcriptional regulator with XRE-family HTH domain